MSNKDALGDRMKSCYEDRTRYKLPRRTYTIIRIDGKCFHSYTKNCKRPYDTELMDAMDFTARYLCENITGARFAYVQSDEISIVLTDFDKPKTEAWFDGNIQKICSISASMATLQFNRIRGAQSVVNNYYPAFFDSRVFTIPDKEEVMNYFIWRQQDATRNSISMAAQSQFSHKQLEGVNSDKMQDMLFVEKGINWNDYPAGFKRGRCIIREKTTEDFLYTDKRTGKINKVENVERKVWNIVDPPVFTQDKEWLNKCISII